MRLTLVTSVFLVCFGWLSCLPLLDTNFCAEGVHPTQDHTAAGIQPGPESRSNCSHNSSSSNSKRPTHLAPSGMPATINATFETAPPAQPTLAKHNRGIAITLHRNCHSTPHKFPRDTQCLRPNTTTQGHALNTPTGTAQGPRPPTASHERCALPEHRQTRQPEHHTIKPQVQVPAAGQKDNKVKGRYDDQQWVAIDTPLVSFWKNVADWLTRLPSGIFL